MNSVIDCPLEFAPLRSKDSCAAEILKFIRWDFGSRVVVAIAVHLVRTVYDKALRMRRLHEATGMISSKQKAVCDCKYQKAQSKPFTFEGLEVFDY